MFLPRTTLKYLAFFLVILLATAAASQQQKSPDATQDKKDNGRDIIANDFLDKRPGKPRRKKPATYRVAEAATKRFDQARVQVGVTIWRLEPEAPESSTTQSSTSGNFGRRAEWMPRRVEADAKFREGDAIRISIESPRNGYLYVVNRDLLADGSYGESNLIFPTSGDDNRLRAGKLIDLPAQEDPPFTATPKADQSSELLTIIVTLSPLQLPLSSKPLPISIKQLTEWENQWGAEAERLEMNGGAGQTRTIEEQLAASSTRTRQLTRNDPMPQTIYSLSPKNPNALLFNLTLSYVR